MNLLDERGEKYGNYLKQATLIRDFMAVTNATAYYDLDPDQKDAIYMIMVKVSRILNGDPDYPDNWRDIAGYSTLVADRLDGNERL